jgi:creatinine amidohydrolase
LAHEFGLPVVATTPWFIPGLKIAEVMETAPNAQHACEGETSVMMAMMPEQVRTAKLEEAVQQAPAAVPSAPGFSRFRSFAERAPITGTVGDPRPASAAKGERLLNIMAEALAQAIRDPVLWQRPDAVWASGRGQRTTAGVG